MFKLFQSTAFAILTLAAATLSMAQGLPATAVMQLGNQGTGSPFPPHHDGSIHAQDKFVPRTVTVAEGGTVTFVLNNNVHGFAVYVAGTQPADIDTTDVELLAGCPPVPYIDDANGRMAAYAPVCAGGTQAPQVQFNTPGRYLVICTFAPHFTEADMWGWVIVGKDHA